MRSLPGEPTAQERLAAMLRVDHAGEYGAKRIYEGQLAMLRGRASYPTIQHMKQQEEAHLAAFERLLVERRVRPTVLLPLWHVGGFALGAVTALLGEKAAMACTVAVESVIDGHYAAQEEQLGASEPALKATIARFRAEEMEHHDTGLAHGAQEAPLYELLHRSIAAVTRTAIRLSSRF